MSYIVLIVQQHGVGGKYLGGFVAHLPAAAFDKGLQLRLGPGLGLGQTGFLPLRVRAGALGGGGPYTVIAMQTALHLTGADALAQQRNHR